MTPRMTPKTDFQGRFWHISMKQAKITSQFKSQLGQKSLSSWHIMGLPSLKIHATLLQITIVTIIICCLTFEISFVVFTENIQYDECWCCVGSSLGFKGWFSGGGDWLSLLELGLSLHACESRSSLKLSVLSGSGTATRDTQGPEDTAVRKNFLWQAVMSSQESK